MMEALETFLLIIGLCLFAVFSISRYLKKRKEGKDPLDAAIEAFDETMENKDEIDEAVDKVEDLIEDVETLMPPGENNVK